MIRRSVCAVQNTSIVIITCSFVPELQQLIANTRASDMNEARNSAGHAAVALPRNLCRCHWVLNERTKEGSSRGQQLFPAT